MKGTEAKESTIEIVNDLIKINHDRIKGYNKAIEDSGTAEAEFKPLYARMAEESYQYNRELSDVVTKAGGEPANDASVAGKIYPAWMDVKASFSGKDTKSTLITCQFGEDAAQKAYAKALEKESPLPRDVYDLIARQKSLLKGSHDLIRQFRNLYAEV